MRPCFVRTAASLFVALSLVACGDEVTPPARVHQVSFVRPTALVVAPDDQPAAEVFGLLVAADQGVSTEVRWSSTDSTIAKVDAEGVLHLCGPGASVWLTAISTADSSRTATARPNLYARAIGWLGISAITDATTDQPVDITAARGELRLQVFADPTWLDCTGLARLEIVAIPEAAGPVQLVVDRSFSPALRELSQTVPWNTTSLPNGSYQLIVRGYLAGHTLPAITHTLAIDVAN